MLTLSYSSYNVYSFEIHFYLRLCLEMAVIKKCFCNVAMATAMHKKNILLRRAFFISSDWTCGLGKSMWICGLHYYT